jgi:hypothetical protein
VILSIFFICHTNTIELKTHSKLKISNLKSSLTSNKRNAAEKKQNNKPDLVFVCFGYRGNATLRQPKALFPEGKEPKTGRNPPNQSAREHKFFRPAQEAYSFIV